MLNSIDYPMPYNAPRVVEYFEVSPLVAFLTIIAFACASLALYIFFRPTVKSEGSTGLILTICILFSLASLSFGFLQFNNHMANVEQAISSSEAKDAYDASIIKWFSEDYGIKVDASALARLEAGELVVVEYLGTDTLIELVERADTGLAIRVVSDELLAPLAS